MKTLIYAMQSSGASLFSYWLAQQENCLGIIDLYYDQIAPKIDHENVVLKCVIVDNILLEKHLDSFQPDRTILFVRNPVENYLSLCEKSYGLFGGSVDSKLKILDKCLEDKFDHVIKYEDFIAKKIKIGCESYYDFKKPLNKIIEYNNLNNKWCKDNYKKKWGMGNIHINNLKIMNDYFPNLNKLY